jgi:DNA-directed RNA polymerase alpha subunit
MTVETNGAVTPEDAVAYAARILQDQLGLRQLRRAAKEVAAEEAKPIWRSTRRCSRRWTSSNCRSVRPTA